MLVRCSRGDDPDREDDADLVVEVLSPSTSDSDLSEKLSEYATVPGLRQYLVVDPVAEHAFLFQRHDLGWHVTEHGPKAAAGGDVTVCGVLLDLLEVFGYARRKLGEA